MAVHALLKQGIKRQTAGAKSLTNYCKHFYSISIPCIAHSEQSY